MWSTCPQNSHLIIFSPKNKLIIKGTCPSNGNLSFGLERKGLEIYRACQGLFFVVKTILGIKVV